MSQITLKNQSAAQVTVLSNHFIDTYMPRANGEFVKVYIALLRALGGSKPSLDPEQLADALLCTEKDILRALRYWEKEGLMKLTFGADQSLRAVAFLNPAEAVPRTPDIATLSATSAIRETSPSAAVAPDATRLTPDRVKELKSSEDIAMLLYTAEQYLARPLSNTEMQKFLYFNDVLKMSPDLIEYLIEYSVSHNHKSVRYMETVALAWCQEGIRTVEEAKQSSSLYKKEYFSILRSMGVNNRNPVDEEVSLMSRWLNEYGFDLSVILEACSRTVMQTGQGSFPYADRILTDWKDHKVHTLVDVKTLDEDYKRKKKSRAESKKEPARTSNASNNRFNNFHQREYDFADYEKLLLRQTSGNDRT